jgi:large subunit ribosomal protein L28e
MVQIADSLTWELIKHNNCFLKKKSGKTKRTGTISFSSEKGNIKSLSQFKYSGIANSKTFDVSCTDDNKAELFIKTASKCGTQPNKSSATIPLNKSDFRKVEATIKNTTSGVFYRRDLEGAALAKWTKVYQGNKRANGTKKTRPCKKGRGTL